MSVTVVILALDDAAGLALTIESVRQQDCAAVEPIVVDFGSIDGTADVLARYALDAVLHAEGEGVARAMNLALERCRGTFALFLDAGDTLHAAESLGRMLACRREGVDAAFGNHVERAGRRDRFRHSHDFELSMAQLMEGAVDARWLACLPRRQSTLLRVEMLRRLRFDPALEGCVEHELMLRAHAAGARFQYVDETVSLCGPPRAPGTPGPPGPPGATSPERLALERCALFRRHSARPAAVDRFFLAGEPSPFGPQNEVTGTLVGGDYPAEPGDPAWGFDGPLAWCRPDGTRLRVPERGACWILHIEGYCPFEEQQLHLFCEGEEIGATPLERGAFRRDIPLTRIPEAGSIVEVATRRFGEPAPGDHRLVGFALSSFAFRGGRHAPPLLVPNEVVAFKADNRAATERMLGSGWSGQEEEFVWAVGEVAMLWLRPALGVTALVLRCKGNPFVRDEARRGLEITIDGQPMGTHLLGDQSAEDVVVGYHGLPPAGVSRVELRPLQRLGSEADGRTLGFLLAALECR